MDSCTCRNYALLNTRVVSFWQMNDNDNDNDSDNGQLTKLGELERKPLDEFSLLDTCFVVRLHIIGSLDSLIATCKQ